MKASPPPQPDRSALYRAQQRRDGIAWARAWRERTRAYFDALYGPERASCPVCADRNG